MKIKYKIAEVLAAKPNTTNKALAKKFKVTSRYVQLIRRELGLPNADSRGRKAVQLPKGMEEAFKEVAYQATRGRQAREADTKTNVDAILDERGSRYGLYGTQAVIAQMLKDTVDHYMEARKYEGDINHYFIVRETLQMICTKMARIINGDSTYADSWIDIAGYAQLVADHLQGKER
jgi:hypothetical protein